jgi:hypothetical protein
MGNLCCARKHSFQFFVQLFYTVRLHSLPLSVWGPLGRDDHCVPSDYHRVEPLNAGLRRREFSSDDEIKDSVHMWLRSQA